MINIVVEFYFRLLADQSEKINQVVVAHGFSKDRWHENVVAH